VTSNVTESGKARPTRLWARIGLACGAFLVGLVICEIGVRILGLAPVVKSLGVAGVESVYQRSANPLLGFELKTSYRNPDADFSRSYPFTNAHGQRDIERTLAKRDGARRVLLLGDSVVEGHDIRDLEDTISRQLERMFVPGTTEVLNFGVSGYCTRAEVELLEVKGLSFEPDDVVLVFTANDFDNFNREAFRLENPVARPVLVEQLFLRSQLFRLLSLQRNWFNFGAEFDPVGWNTRAIAENNVDAGLRRLAELSALHGFRVLVAVWPVFESGGVQDVHLMSDGSGDLVVERLARMYGLNSLRLSDAFDSDAAMREAVVDFRRLYTVGDKLHPSPEGCRVAADALKWALTDPKRLDDAGPTLESIDELAVATAQALGGAKADYSRVYNNAGLALKAEGRDTEALEKFRDSIAVDDAYAEAHSNLAGVLWVRGQLDEAVAHYRRAVEIEPDRVDLHYNLGLALGSMDEADAALEQFRLALQIDPGSAQVHRALGRSLASRGEPDQAIAHYRRALEREPDDADLNFELGSTLASQRRFDEAAAVFEHALRIEPDHARALGNLATIHASQGRLAEAIREFRRALEIDPDYAFAHRNLARALMATGE